MAQHDHCHLCELEDAADELIVFRDENWACEIPTGLEAPGWFFLRARRHAIGWTELTPPEASTFGAAAQRLEAAIRHAMGVPKVYFVSFGENHPHFHFLAIARPADLDPSWRGAALISHAAQLRDPAASLEVAARVRDALAPASPR